MLMTIFLMTIIIPKLDFNRNFQPAGHNQGSTIVIITIGATTDSTFSQTKNFNENILQTEILEQMRLFILTLIFYGKRYLIIFILKLLFRVLILNELKNFVTSLLATVVVAGLATVDPSEKCRL